MHVVERDNGLPFVSVVVPTFNRKRLLRNCLNSLIRLDYPRSKFEIIVVDNGCTDNTEEMVQRDFSDVRFLLEKRKGVVYARNTGSNHAKGLIVAYTDDDCVVDPDWLRNLVSGFTSREIGGVGGPVFHLRPESVPERFWCYRTRPFYLGERRRLVRTLVSGNLAVRREVFEKTKFDESLTYHDSEDIDFSRSLIEAGYKLAYVPNANVYHDIDPRRSRVQYVLERAFFGGLSFYIVERKRTNGILVPRFLRSFLAGLLDFFRGRRVADIYWLVECFVAFLASIFFISRGGRKRPRGKVYNI